MLILVQAPLSHERYVPWDITASIVSQVDHQTLKTLSLVSKDLEVEAGKYLWSDVTIRTLGQSPETAQEHVDTKLRVLRKQVGNIQSLSLEMYRGNQDCSFWDKECDGGKALKELFELLGRMKLRKLQLNLDAYSPNVIIPALDQFRLPALRSLSISLNNTTTLDFLLPSLDTLEVLSLKCETTVVPTDSAMTKSLPPASIFRSLKELEVARGWQLSWLQSSSFPALRHFSTVVSSTEPPDTLRQFLLSLAPSTDSGSVTGLTTLSIRAASVSGAAVPWFRAAIYTSLLLDPQVHSSGVLASLEDLILVHEPPACESLDELILELVTTYPSLRTISLSLPFAAISNPVSIILPDIVLEKIFPPRTACCSGSSSGSKGQSGGGGALQRLTMQLLMPFPPWDLERVYYRNKEEMVPIQGSIWGTYESGGDCY